MPENSGSGKIAWFSAEVPPQVEYRWNALNATWIPSLAGLHDWTEWHGEMIVENRRQVDEDRAASAEVESVQDR